MPIHEEEHEERQSHDEADRHSVNWEFPSISHVYTLSLSILTRALREVRGLQAKEFCLFVRWYDLAQFRCLFPPPPPLPSSLALPFHSDYYTALNSLPSSVHLFPHSHSIYYAPWKTRVSLARALKPLLYSVPYNCNLSFSITICYLLSVRVIALLCMFKFSIISLIHRSIPFYCPIGVSLPHISFFNLLSRERKLRRLSPIALFSLIPFSMIVILFSFPASLIF